MDHHPSVRAANFLASLVREVDLLEPLLGLGVGVGVRVQLERQPSILLLELVGR